MAKRGRPRKVFRDWYRQENKRESNVVGYTEKTVWAPNNIFELNEIYECFPLKLLLSIMGFLITWALFSCFNQLANFYPGETPYPMHVIGLQFAIIVFVVITLTIIVWTLAPIFNFERVKVIKE